MRSPTRRAAKTRRAECWPELEQLDAEEIRKLLRRARLSREDRQIAISRLVWRMDYVDIGAAVYMDRTSVSRRMRKIIAPTLQMMISKKAKIAGA